MARSKIEWTESTWNPVTGCTKISDGCKNCYAERMARRLKAMGSPNYKDGFELRCHERSLNIPLHWKKPRIIFVNSMSDLFHKDVPESFIQKTVDIMEQCPQHIFQILTKRSERMKKISHKLDFPENAWLGVSVESDKYTERIEHLRQVKANIKFLSLEPLLGQIPNLNLTDIHWVIVGGESGPNSRPIKKEWVLQIKNTCLNQNTPFFFKQWGGFNKKANGRTLEGRKWSEMPKQIRATI